MTTNAANSDPASLLNCTVKIQNLQSKPELNDQIGSVQSYNPQRNRYNIQLYNASPINPPIALKADNLIQATMVEKVKGQFQSMKTMILFMKENPQVKEQLRQVYKDVHDKLPNGVKPEYALGGSLLLFMGVIYFVGFMKTIMFFSMLGIVGVVALPDITYILNRGGSINATEMKSIATNFPFRWRTMIQEQTGYSLNPKVANGILVGLLLLSTKVLITPLGGRSSGGEKGTKLTQTEIDMMNQQQHQQQHRRQSQGPSFTVEEIYKMGYDDATKSLDFGTSLPENYESFHFTTSSSNSGEQEEETFEYDYKPTTPPLPNYHTNGGNSNTNRGSKIGFGTLMSMFALFRSVKELGFRDGRFDLPLFMANVQNMPPLKMAFMGFMLYRVISAFL